MPENLKKGTFFNFFAYSLSGLFIFLFNIIAARGLGTAKFGIISVLWSSIIISSRFLTTGIKDGTTRFISHYEAMDNRTKMRRVFQLGIRFTTFVIIIFLFLNLLFAKLIIKHLFSSYLSLFFLFVFSCVFYFFLFFSRGVFQGLRELKHSAISIVIEYSTMLISLIIFFLFFRDVRLAGLSILFAPFMSLIFLAMIFQRHKKRFSSYSDTSPDTKTFLLFVIPTSFINFSSGFITSLGPLLIKFLGGFSLAGIFAASLVIFKATRTVLASLFISILPHLSRQEALKNFRLLNKMVRYGIIFIVFVFILLIIVSLTVGQSILKFLYGDKFVIEKVHLLLMSLFTGFFLLAELFNRILLAKSMIKELSISWLIAFGIFVIILFFPLSAFFRVESALLAAGIVASVGMTLFLLKRTHDEKKAEESDNLS